MTFESLDPNQLDPTLLDSARTITKAYQNESFHVGSLISDDGSSIKEILAAKDYPEDPTTSISRPCYFRSTPLHQPYNDFEEELEIAADIERSLVGILNDAAKCKLPENLCISYFHRKGRETSDLFSVTKITIPTLNREIWILTYESNCRTIHDITEIKSKLEIVKHVKGEYRDNEDFEFAREGLSLTYRLRHTLSGERFLIWPDREYKKESCIFIPDSSSLILYSHYDKQSFPVAYEVDLTSNEVGSENLEELRYAKSTCSHLIWLTRSMLRDIAKL